MAGRMPKVGGDSVWKLIGVDAGESVCITDGRIDERISKRRVACGRLSERNGSGLGRYGHPIPTCCLLQACKRKKGLLLHYCAQRTSKRDVSSGVDEAGENKASRKSNKKPLLPAAKDISLALATTTTLPRGTKAKKARRRKGPRPEPTDQQCRSAVACFLRGLCKQTVKWGGGVLWSTPNNRQVFVGTFSCELQLQLYLQSSDAALCFVLRHLVNVCFLNPSSIPQLTCIKPLGYLLRRTLASKAMRTNFATFFC